MRQIVFKKGKVVVEEVSTPVCGANQVLVENLYSLISAGTELSSLVFSHQPLPLKVLKYPTKLAKGLRLVKQHGLKDAYNIVKGMLDMGVTPGYSCSGRVVKVGKNVKGIRKGDIVACAGANFASHAEFVAVPRNLVVVVPPNVPEEDAASTTLGAIALQGVRQADLRVGESAVVIGLGLVGQLVTQILLASGIKVIGVEISKARIKKAKENGLLYAFSPTDKKLSLQINRLTNLQGADATIITAAAPNNNQIINQAFLLTRKRGKVVVVGDVGLGIQRLPWYEKEIDLRISTSYGPGRGDKDYENKGIDYPYAYVRWTENRNMQAYLGLLAEKKINFSSLVGGKYVLDDAALAYQLLRSPKRPLAVLLDYGKTEKKDASTSIILAPPQKIQGRIEVGFVGVGSFAQTVHLPNLKKLSNFYHLRGICTRQAVKAKYFAQRFKAEIATTDYHDLLNDPKINLIMITTRHNLHAPMVLAALRSGKNVFVEKPLCLTSQELEDIEKTLQNQKLGYSPILMVGFNRRFSPFARKIKEMIKGHHSPLVINYRVNDSYLPPSHWVNTSEGGGRILGNACHMFDLFCYFTESEAEKIDAISLASPDKFYLPSDNFIASIKFKDGSIANLTYTTEGDSKLPKEYMELYSEGRVFIIDDYRTLRVLGAKGNWQMRYQNKGHQEELEALASALHQRRWPFSFQEIKEAMRISLEVDKQIRQGE